MKKMGLFIILVVTFLSGCSNPITNPIKGDTIIDWVDFVKWDGKSYNGLREGVIRDPNDITEEVIGEVKFRVGDVVTNPNYRTKDGDAAFLDIGTKLYKVKGFSENQLIAAKDNRRIGGYRLYAEEKEFESLNLHYNDVPKHKVERIELFHSGDTSVFRTLTDLEKEKFIQLLDSGKDSKGYNPNNANGDPIYYDMVFYTDSPIAYNYSLADDGDHVYFHPWNTRIVEDEIRTLIQVDTKSEE